MKRIALILILMISILISCTQNPANASPQTTESLPSFTPVSQTPAPVPTSTPFPQANITVCATGCDFSSIMDAINSESSSDGTIIGVFDPVHTEARIQISKNIIVQGKGSQQTIVQAHSTPREGVDRVFEILPDVNATIRGMTIQHGNPITSPLTGGGVLNLGTLMMVDTIVQKNFGSAGGGIYNEGALTLINSTIRDNGSVGGGDAYLECKTGGGLKVLTGTTTLINTTVSDNRANSKGGGIHVACHGKLIMQNSTISGNFATESGGGVYLNGSAEITNSTISNNSASNVGGIAANGRDEIEEYGHLILFNTIISGNFARIGDYGISDCHMEGHAEMIASRFNWIADGNCGPTFSGDPLLGPLTDNGGPTLTHSLLPGSNAIDSVPAEYCTVEIDQRGEFRTSLCDIGAYEVQMP